MQLFIQRSQSYFVISRTSIGQITWKVSALRHLIIKIKVFVLASSQGKIQNKINEEFSELSTRWQTFIARFESLAPKVYANKSNVFHNMLSAERTKKTFVEMSSETRPFVAKELWELMEVFMEFMRNLPDPEGKNYKAVYEGMTPADLIKRLLTKRPIVFYKAHDDHMLRCDPLKMQSGRGKWDVAKTLEKARNDFPYLREYISYDEMLLSALVNMSTPTFFISDGSLKSPTAKPTKPFERSGVLCGIVGARLKKKGFMEHRFVFPRDAKNASFALVHRADLFWIKNVFPEAFPEDKIPTIDDITRDPQLYSGIYVDGINVVYLKKRLTFSTIPFIKEAIQRGKEKQRAVVASIPAIGGGVWRGTVPSKTIVQLLIIGILEYFDERFDIKGLEHLRALYLPVADLQIYSSFIARKNISLIKVIASAKTIEIKFKGSDKILTIFNQPRYVAQLLPQMFKTCLVVAGYAWDGNSYPGNNYWIDSFSSFDPQAILCSLLGQFQNPEVNVNLADPERIKIY